MTPDEQIQLWVDGNSVHGEECCPDFSCCRPDIVTPLRDRQRFQKSQQEEDEKMVRRFLFSFLGHAISTYEWEGEKAKKVYLAGDPDADLLDMGSGP